MSMGNLPLMAVMVGPHRNPAKPARCFDHKSFPPTNSLRSIMRAGNPSPSPSEAARRALLATVAMVHWAPDTEVCDDALKQKRGGMWSGHNDGWRALRFEPAGRAPVRWLRSRNPLHGLSRCRRLARALVECARKLCGTAQEMTRESEIQRGGRACYSTPSLADRLSAR